MKLPRPPEKYDERDQIALRSQLEKADGESLKRRTNIDMGPGLIILTAPDGGRWSLAVDNAGALSTVAV